MAFVLALTVRVPSRVSWALSGSALVVALYATGCTSARGDAAETTSAPMLSHSFPAIDLPPGGEASRLCQSWTLGNEVPLYVSTVQMRSGGGFHHSNWFFVPEDRYPGPDGTWGCDERSFSELDAGTGGGGVFFA